jgi:electron transport complex protein RnfC
MKNKYDIERDCIRCGWCVDACPKQLIPSMLAKYSKNKKYEYCSRYYINLCIECGACKRVCPANIPITDYIKNAKSELVKGCCK